VKLEEKISFISPVLFLLTTVRKKGDVEMLEYQKNEKHEETTVENQSETATMYLTYDKDSNQKYKVVRMPDGNIWMAQNLNFKIEGSSWCYNNDEANGDKYGRLYTWDAANKACPKGWRLPKTPDLWMLGHIFGNWVALPSEKLKAKSGWISRGTDNYGFSALPGGMRNEDGDFTGLGFASRLWLDTTLMGGEGCADAYCVCDGYCGMFSSVKVGCGCSVRYILC